MIVARLLRYEDARVMDSSEHSNSIGRVLSLEYYEKI